MLVNLAAGSPSAYYNKHERLLVLMESTEVCRVQQKLRREGQG